MGSAKQALPVQAMVMTPTGYPADAKECGDGGETEHPPQNPAHFRGEGMRTIRRLFFRVLSVFRSGRADADLAGGTDPHLQLLQDKVPSAAEQAKESQHEAPRWALDSWWLDVKLGVRMLVKYPGLALAGGAGIAVAVAIAAGGIQRNQ